MGAPSLCSPSQLSLHGKEQRWDSGSAKGGWPPEESQATPSYEPPSCYKVHLQKSTWCGEAGTAPLDHGQPARAGMDVGAQRSFLPHQPVGDLNYLLPKSTNNLGKVQDKRARNAGSGRSQQAWRSLLWLGYQDSPPRVFFHLLEFRASKPEVLKDLA